MPTRKATKKSRKLRKLRKTRGRRRTQRGGIDEETLQKKADEACKGIDAVNDIKDATTLYRKAAKEIHPDRGGSTKAFQVLEDCYGKKKKSLEVPQPANDDEDEDEQDAAPSPARSDETGKADLYVYFYRNGRPVKFADLTESQQRSVRGAVLHLPETPLRIQEEGTFGIIKADVKFVNYVNSKKDGVENTLYGNETNAPPIILKLRANRMDGGRKSRR